MVAETEYLETFNNETVHLKNWYKYYTSHTYHRYLPNAEATTANALAVVLRTYSSMLSISGRIVDIIVARPAAFAKFEMISLPSTRA